MHLLAEGIAEIACPVSVAALGSTEQMKRFFAAAFAGAISLLFLSYGGQQRSRQLLVIARRREAGPNKALAV